MNSDIEQLASLAHSQLAHQTAHPVQQQANGNKRKNDDDGQTSGKSKRSRYISLACNECKRRKIKCNGQTPCQRCGNLSLDCVYAANCCPSVKDSQEFKELTAHIGSLQEQVNVLYENLNSLRAQLGHNAPVQQPTSAPQQYQLPSIDPSLQMQSQPASMYSKSTSPSAAARPRSQAQNYSTFRGLTSADFNFGVAKSSLQTMGISTQDADDPSDPPDAGEAQEEVNERGERIYNHRDLVLEPGQLIDTIHSNKDPIWIISEDEALHLCQIYEDETRLMYPVLDIEKLRTYVKKLFPFLNAMRRSGLMQQGMPGADAVEDEDTNVLKMVLAIGLTVKEGGRSDLGKRFFDAVQPLVDNLLLGSVNINGIRLLVMTAVYEFQRDNESTSWRLIGLAARLCIELGLHRHETYKSIQDDAKRAETVLLFWACYVLDRRWSLGTGMPFALQESDLDPILPKPGDSSPYIMAMIRYSEIGSKVWRSLSAPPSADNGGISPINVEDMNFLDYQTLQWHRSLPQSLQYDRHGQHEAESLAERSSLRSKLVIYLRANQMRILIHRPILHSATTIMQNHELAQKVVDISKDTVRVLTHINRMTDLYQTQQVVFHAFLTSALAVLFLAISHTPAFFASEVREEFYMALDLVRGLSKGSYVSRRLWRTIRSLKDLAPRLGLTEDEPGIASAVARHEVKRNAKNDVDPSRSAAVAMAGLAGHSVDENALFSGTSPQTWASSETDSAGNPDNMANDLVRMFEAASNMPEGVTQTDATLRTSEQQNGLGVGQMPLALGEDELSNVLRDLF